MNWSPPDQSWPLNPRHSDQATRSPASGALHRGDPFRTGSRLGPAKCPHLGGRRQDDEGAASERSGRSEDRCQHARGRHGCGWSRGQRGPEAGQTRLRRSPVFRSESGGGLMTLPGDPWPRLGRRPGRGSLIPEWDRTTELGLIQERLPDRDRTRLSVAGVSQRASTGPNQD